MITLPEFRTYLGATETADDALLLDMIAAATAFVESEAGTGRVWTAASATRTYDAVRDVDGRALYLDADLVSVTTLTNGDGATIAPSAYVLERSGGGRNAPPYRIVRLKANGTVDWRYTTDPEGAISVAGLWGAASAPPERIRQIAREVAAYLYRRRTASGDAGADRPLLTGDGVTVLAARLPADLMARIRAERSIT